MSGIVGIWEQEGRPLNPGVLKRMMDRMAHRGPDAAGHWINGSLALGHLLLRTTPESLSERGPMFDQSGDCVLVWDGRVDNREELQSALGANFSGGEVVADPSLVLEAYRRWGVDCVKRMAGDFAFGIWDARQRYLFCARDPLGVKPFYYHWDGYRFIFASEIKALLEHPSVIKRPNEKMIADYLLMGFRDPEETFFEEIQQLRPAHFLRVKEGGLHVKRYWDLNPGCETRYSRENEYLDRFQELFRKSVECRIRASSPVGVLLSGGIDSVSVAAMAQTLARQNGNGPQPAAFTLLAEGLLQEEWDAIGALAKIYGTEIHSMRCNSPTGPLTLFELYLDCAETPHHDGFLTTPLTMTPVVRRGCRTLLTGLGADELSHDGERGFLNDLLRSGRVMRFLSEAASMSLAYGGNGNRREAVLRGLWTQLPPRVRWFAKTLLRSQVPVWFEPSFAQKVRLKWWVKPQPARKFADLSREESYRALVAPSMALAMNQVDGLASRFSIECRHPYLDRRLIEFFLSVPSSVKMKFGYRKMFVQTALAGIVPGPLRKQESQEYFVSPMDIRKSKELEAKRLQQILLKGGAQVYQYVNRQQVERMMEQYFRGEAKASCRNLLWSFAKLELWLQKWFSQ